jgi:hypothetical protein
MMGPASGESPSGPVGRAQREAQRLYGEKSADY